MDKNNSNKKTGNKSESQANEEKQTQKKAPGKTGDETKAKPSSGSAKNSK